MNKTMRTACAAVQMIVLAIITTGAALAQSGTTYARQQTQTIGTAIEAVVIQVADRQVEPNWQTRTAGGAIGAAFGLAITGDAGDRHRAAMSTLGATLGALFGERGANRVLADDAQEIIVQTAGEVPRLMVITQPAPSDRFVPGERVLVVNHAGTVRIVRLGALRANGSLL